MNITKLIICAVLSAAMLQIAAFAEETNENYYTDNYFAVGNALDLGEADDSSTTVLIVKVDNTNDEEYQDTDIVYVNQSSSDFNIMSTAFMLKADPEAGLYKVILGGGDSASVGYFNIGMTLKEADVAMDSGTAENGYIESYTANGSEVYKKGFLKTVTADECNAYKSIKLVENQVMGAWSLTGGESSTVTSGDGNVLMGVQIYNIPDKATADKLEVYLSTDEISTAEVETE